MTTNPSRDELTAAGVAVRTKVPFAALAKWKPARARPDPVDLIAGQAATRVPQLVPVRHARMAVSPFAYYRGAALPMAADLAAGPSTGSPSSWAATRISRTSGCSRRRSGPCCST